MVKSIRLWLIVAISLTALLASAPAFAARGDSGRRGGDYRGGHAGTYFRGGERHGGYYRGGEHHGGFYGNRHGYYRGWDHHGGGDWDVVIGGYWGPWWGYGWPYSYPYYSPYYPYYYPYYPSYPNYYSPSVVVPEGSQTYIERQEPESSSPASTKWPEDWFYCPGSKSYYPYVKECPGGWKTVPARPPSESGKVSPSGSSTPAGVWYYCPDSKSYYPYTQRCPGGWKTVPVKPGGPER